MTATLNRVQLIGNIGAAPKSVTTNDGKVFVTASLATNEAVKIDDKWENKVEWHQLVFFGSMVKISEHLLKGSQVYIEGKLRLNTWTDNNGGTHRTTTIVVNNVQLLNGSKSKSNQAEPADLSSADTHLAQMREMLEASPDANPF